MTIGIILTIIFLILAVIILMGKGDFLIAGYNTASEEKKKRVDIRRLRVLTTAMMVLASYYCFYVATIGQETKTGVIIATVLFVIVTITFIVLANTWTKKK